MVFIVITTFGLLNVIIGVIVESTMSAGQENEQDKINEERDAQLAQIDRITQACLKYNTDGDRMISVQELSRAVQDPEVHDILATLEGFPPGVELDEFFLLLDEEGTGQVSEKDCIKHIS